MLMVVNISGDNFTGENCFFPCKWVSAEDRFLVRNETGVLCFGIVSDLNMAKLCALCQVMYELR